MLAAFVSPESYGSLLCRDVINILIVMQPTAMLLERKIPLPESFKRFSVDAYNTVLLHSCIEPLPRLSTMYPVKAYSLPNEVTMDIAGYVHYNKEVTLLGPRAYEIDQVMVGDRMVFYVRNNKMYVLFIYETLNKVFRLHLRSDSQVLIRDSHLYIASRRNLYVLCTDHLPHNKCNR
jgi:hypothetical protein